MITMLTLWPPGPFKMQLLVMD